MIEKIVALFLLIAVTVLINAAGLTVMMRRLNFERVPPGGGFWHPTWMLIRFAAYMVGIHLVAMTVWALYYAFEGCFVDFESSLYFSAVTYTTVGYGDLVLPPGWRLFAGVEALMGILMCGLSTGFFFAIVHGLLEARRPKG